MGHLSFEGKSVVCAQRWRIRAEAQYSLSTHKYCGMPALFTCFIAVGKTTAVYPLCEYWLDIGRLKAFGWAQRV